jgi:pentatricopeptide repeat protein
MKSHLHAFASVAGSELQVLPFLAPRAFTPWPVALRAKRYWSTDGTRRSLSTAAAERRLEQPGEFKPHLHLGSLEGNVKYAMSPLSPVTRKSKSVELLEGLGEPEIILTRTGKGRSANRSSVALVSKVKRIARRYTGTNVTSKTKSTIGYGHRLDGRVRRLHRPTYRVWQEERLSKKSFENDKNLRRLALGVSAEGLTLKDALDRGRERKTQRKSEGRVISLQVVDPITGKLQWMSPRWMEAYAVLSSHFEADREPIPYSALDYHPHVQEWVNALGKGGKDIDMIRKCWEELDVDDHHRQEAWESLMIWALAHHPELAMILLEALHSSEYAFDFAVADSMVLLIHNSAFTDEGEVGYRFPGRLLDLYADILRQRPNKNFFPANRLHTFLGICDAKQSERLYHLLKDYQVSVPTDTKLHFLRNALKYDRVQIAVGLLDDVAQAFDGAPINDRFRRAAQAVLKHSAKVDGFGGAMKALKKLCAHGVMPNQFVYNDLLLHIVKFGGFEQGWRFFELMRPMGFEPTDVTYAILLNDAKKRADWEEIDRITNIPEIQFRLARDPYLATDLLHIVYQSHVSATPENSAFNGFQPMLELYSTTFDLQPLKELGIAPLNMHQDLKKPKLKPTANTVTVMMIAAIRTMWHSETKRLHGMSVHDLYIRYKEVADAASSSVPLVTGATLPNAFIYTFAASKETLGTCMDVIAHMMKPLPTREALGSGSLHPGTESTDKDTIIPGLAHTPVKQGPDEQTWSILLIAFFKHGQIKAGEKVFAMMRRKGLEPSHAVTWNTIAAGYARKQDIPRVVSTIRDMQEKGHKFDTQGLKGLALVKDRDKLLRAFNEAEVGFNKEGGFESVQNVGLQGAKYDGLKVEEWNEDGSEEEGDRLDEGGESE